MNETQHALLEGAQIAASDQYFEARPQIDTMGMRRVFEAGFDRAWKAPHSPAPLHAKPKLLTPPAMGEVWPGQGGYYICTMPALLGLPERHLIAGKDEAEDLTYGPNIDVPGATSHIDVPGATSHIDGAANTAALLDTGQEHPAANYARNYTADRHTDFFLPSQLDLLMAFICAKRLFKPEGWYLTSTQVSRLNAFVQDFEYGFSYWGTKASGRRVRAFRAIPTSTL